MSRVHAFGPRAGHAASAYDAPRSRDLLIVDPSGAVEGIQTALRLRQAGKKFDVLPIVDDARTAQARHLGAEILRFTHDFDGRRNSFELLAHGGIVLQGKPQSDYGQLKPETLKTLWDLCSLADGWLVRSWSEYYRISAVLQMRPENVERIIAIDREVPRVVVDADADAIVVWAPQEQAQDIATILFALEELRRPTYVVCRPGALYGLKTVFVSEEASARVLRRAQVLIEASVHQPGAALAFLAQQINTIADAGSGAAEYAPGIRTFHNWNRRSVVAAVLAALGEAPATVTIPQPQLPKKPAAPARVEERSPGVSIIVRTIGNRLRFLRRALASIAAQTYAHVETIVVNDGGASLGDIGTATPLLRVLEIPKGGASAAGNAGLLAASADYSGFLDDDDALLPDHVERLVGALQKSGAMAAYADSMNLYFRPIGKNYAMTGARIIGVPAIQRTPMLSSCQVYGSSRMLFRTAFARELGGLDAGLFPADDYALWLAMVHCGDIVRVSGVTSLYSQFSDGSNSSVGDGRAYARVHELIYAKFASDRVVVQTQRARFLQGLRQFGGLGIVQAPLRFDPQPLLFQE